MKRLFLLSVLVLFAITSFAGNKLNHELIERKMEITLPSFTLIEDNKTLDTINDTLYSDSFKLLNGFQDTSEGFRSWDATVYISESTVTHQSEKTLSFTTTQYLYYYHAAHGMHLLLGYIFDAETGKKLTLDDLFTGDAYKTKILDYMNNEIKTKKIPIFSDTAFKGVDKNTEFYLEEDHLVFVFQEYEYTPYAHGFLIFKMPLDDLKEDLNKKYF